MNDIQLQWTSCGRDRDGLHHPDRQRHRNRLVEPDRRCFRRRPDHAFRHHQLRYQDRGRGQGLQPRGVHGPQDRPPHRALLPVRPRGLEASPGTGQPRPCADEPRRRRGHRQLRHRRHGGDRKEPYRADGAGTQADQPLHRPDDDRGHGGGHRRHPYAGGRPELRHRERVCVERARHR